MRTAVVFMCHKKNESIKTQNNSNNMVPTKLKNKQRKKEAKKQTMTVIVPNKETAAAAATTTSGNKRKQAIGAGLTVGLLSGKDESFPWLGMEIDYRQGERWLACRCTST